MPEKEQPSALRSAGDHRYDILIVGAGFAGALTALVLHRLGFSVCLLEKGRHPRFAIGESSTPVADLLLRDLADRYDLPWLHAFSRYGSWQEAHPEIICGIKRGFSYFKHYPDREFATDDAHNQELLVAASASDQRSDTNWLRYDLDAFLVKQVEIAAITYLDRSEITAATRGAEWIFRVDRAAEQLTIHASFLIDATGGAALLYDLLGVRSSSAGFYTDSYAIFSHFDNMPRWSDMLKAAHIPTGDFPYDPDDSAVHHVLDEGWVWVLRFNDRRTSLGFALDRRRQSSAEGQGQQVWDGLLRKYPSIGRMLDGVPLSAMPGRIIQSGRLQRKADRCSGPGWAALPHTAGFVDPLFSSGIAHSLLGVRRLADILGRGWDHPTVLDQELQEYERAIFTELRLVDRLVAGCYATMPHFAIFQAWSMLYFTATIACEQRLLRGVPGGYFLGADDPVVWKMVEDCWSALMKMPGIARHAGEGSMQFSHPSAEDIRLLTDFIRQKILPFNTVGLMNADARNMYRHTVAEFPA